MRVTMIPGDGIGEDISKAMMQVVDASGAKIEWDIVRAGEAVLAEVGELVPDTVYESLERNRVGIKGPITTPIGEGFRSINVSLRKKYDLFANVRPIQSVGQTPALFDNLDLVLFRENTEDLYAGIEKRISDDEMHSIKVITRGASKRIAEQAFDFALANNRKKVTVVTKANIMKLTDGLFLEVARTVASNYPTIEFTEILVDNMAMQLVMNPQQFDVILTENLYGDILSDLMAGLVGGLGIIPSANLGKEFAVFEAVHGSAPDIAGKDLANPTALILSACMMLDHLAQQPAATKIRQALNDVLSDRDNFTRDLGGNVGTKAFTAKIIEALK